MTYHWIAGIVLTVSVIYHLFHATFWLDFWSIWPDQQDIEDASRRLRRALGTAAPAPRKFGKYPLENKLYHLVILCAGLAVIGTGVLMMNRVQTPFFTRNPYLFGFSDMTWGWMYVLHGLAGVALVALIMAHIYFAVRPEKLFITKSMIFGWISREQVPGTLRSAALARSDEASSRARDVREDRSPEFRPRRWATISALVATAIEECYEFMLAYAGQGLAGDEGSQSSGQVRDYLNRAVEALSGLAEAYAAAVKQENLAAAGTLPRIPRRAGARRSRFSRRHPACSGPDHPQLSVDR